MKSDSRTASDQSARERIRHSLQESFIVEAAAGTGKTSELVRRIVAVLQNGLTTVGRIVAVTFTRKAAGELKLRLRQELDRARRESNEATHNRNLETAIAQLEEASVGTIHSFCADILRERPVEAGIDPGFEELSEDQVPRLFDRAFGEWIENKLNDPPAGLRRALSRSISGYGGDRLSPLDRIKEAGWKLAERRDFPKPWRREPFEREKETDGLVGSASELAEKSSRCKKAADELFKALRPARDLAGRIQRAERERRRDYDELEGLLLTLLRELKRNQKKKGKGFFAPGVDREPVLKARENLISGLEEFKIKADADLAALLKAELHGLIQRYEELKARSGALDFVDLLIRARDLIRDNKGIRLYFQQRFSHIFVDEFQDTDPLQAEIVLLLSSDDPEEKDWRNVRPVPGKLFLVGDPKQSIYRFRRADVLLYLEVKEVLMRAGVSLLHLSQSFRAVPAIQQLVNGAFESEINGDSASGQPDYVPLEKFRTAQENHPSIIVLPVPRPYGVYNVTNEAIDSCLPDTVAAFIHWLVEEGGWKVSSLADPGKSVPIAPSHVCVLFRRFISWGDDVTHAYTRALEARGIPHVLVGARSFHQREEVETIRAVLNAVEWPDDELSVFATLRGSLFWIPDALLLRFREKVGKLHPFRPLPDTLPEELKVVGSTLQVLADLHRRRNQHPTVETIHQILELTRAHAGFALRPAGHQVLANLQRICDMARSFEIGGGISFRGFVEQLEREAEGPTSNEAAVLEEGVEGVRLMTVHKAKGLEFPVVVLADITCKLSSGKADRYVDAEQGLAATTILGCAPWELRDHEDVEIRRDEAEGVRIAYVAATRARDLLIIPAIGDGARDGWLRPLNKVIYPPGKQWRESEVAAACPRFGEATVLERPNPGEPESSVKPGLHKPEAGEHRVVWWDPAVLKLNVETHFGLRQEEILAEDREGRLSRAGLEKYQKWKNRREELLQSGRESQFEVTTVTQARALRQPPQLGKINVEVLKRSDGRPTGTRFGTLVHTVLRDVALRADHNAVTRLVQLHSRLLGATEEEVKAAAEAVVSALDHPLLKRAAAAGRCHREFPLIIKAGEKEIVEGTIDLAFKQAGRWVVIDFKTDLTSGNQAVYERQLQWYLYGLTLITQQLAEGWLLGI